MVFWHKMPNRPKGRNNLKSSATTHSSVLQQLTRSPLRRHPASPPAFLQTAAAAVGRHAAGRSRDG